jgi:hypothetical protein
MEEAGASSPSNSKPANLKTVAFSRRDAIVVR